MSGDEGLPEIRGDGAEVSDEDRAAAGRLFGPTEFFNVEAEAIVLGGLMIDNALVADLSARLRQEHFYEPLHGRIFNAIVRMVTAGRDANPVTLRPLFTLDADMKEVGGPGYLATLTGSGVAIAAARGAAEQVIELARMRRIYEAMIGTVRSFQDTGAIAGSVDRLEQEIWTAADQTRPIEILGADEMIGLAQERAARISEAASSSVGAISRTLPEINDMLGGLEPEQMTLIAARPSMGKTTVALSFAWGCAANGHPVFYGSAESSKEMTALKVAADINYDLGERVEFSRIRDGKLHRQEADALDAAKAKAAQLPIRYADIGRMDVHRLEALVARECAYWEARGRKLELVIVDYIQLIGFAGEKDPNRAAGMVSKALLDMAKKYKFHVIALAQLSRKVEDRGGSATDKRPQLADLRNSGDLEQDADNVLFIHRPEFYLVDEKPKPDAAKPQVYEAKLRDWECDMAEWRDKAELIGAKTRFAKRTSRRVKFLGDYSAVRSLTHRRPDVDDDGGEDLFMEGSR